MLGFSKIGLFVMCVYRMPGELQDVIDGHRTIHRRAGVDANEEGSRQVTHVLPKVNNDKL